MRQPPNYILRRLDFEEKGMGKTEVLWAGERISIKKAKKKARALPDDATAKVEPFKPSPDELTSFSDFDYI